MPRRSTGSLGTWMFDSPIRYWRAAHPDGWALYRTNDDEGPFGTLEEWEHGAWVEAGQAMDLLGLEGKPVRPEEAQRMIDLGLTRSGS